MKTSFLKGKSNTVDMHITHFGQESCWTYLHECDSKYRTSPFFKRADV